MSAVLGSEKVISDVSPILEALEIREGDWKAYLYCIAKCNTDKELIDSYGGEVGYRRACALAYLGKRAQLHGGVCSTRHPHIMTPQFTAELETNNKALRYARYPWLRAYMNLLAEIEQIQDQISNTNVISLVPAAR